VDAGAKPEIVAQAAIPEALEAAPRVNQGDDLLVQFLLKQVMQIAAFLMRSEKGNVTLRLEQIAHFKRSWIGFAVRVMGDRSARKLPDGIADKRVRR
jgi:hypothetical protein